MIEIFTSDYTPYVLYAIVLTIVIYRSRDTKAKVVKDKTKDREKSLYD